MSIKAIKEALDYLENNPTAEEAQSVRRRARAEVAALEKAAAAVTNWCKCVAISDEGRKAGDDAMLYLYRIAKEARK